MILISVRKDFQKLIWNLEISRVFQNSFFFKRKKTSLLLSASLQIGRQEQRRGAKTYYPEFVSVCDIDVHINNHVLKKAITCTRFLFFAVFSLPSRICEAGRPANVAQATQNTVIYNSPSIQQQGQQPARRYT